MQWRNGLPILERAEDFNVWKMVLKAHLETEGVWLHVTGQIKRPVEDSPDKVEWMKADRKAKTILFSTLSEKTLAQLEEYEHLYQGKEGFYAYMVWLWLKNSYLGVLRRRSQGSA